MSHGITNGLIFGGSVGIADGANLDAFSRLRTSNLETLWSVQSQYTRNRLMMEAGSTGTGTSTPTHNSSTRLVKLEATAGTGTAFLQSYEYIPYQPLKSTEIAVTGVMGTAVAGAVVEFGSFDAANGHIYRQKSTNGLFLVQRSSTGGSVAEIEVPQADWSEDKLDGTGLSGITLNATKNFIFMIDLQYLGMGRVRVGFDIGGSIIYAHEFLAANQLSVPYMQTATLPIQALITTTATATTKTAYFKCAAVGSEGGLNVVDAYPLSTPEVTETASSGARTHLLSIRPKTTFEGITNREKFALTSLSFLATGVNPVYWEMCIGATNAASTWADINTTYSGFEYTSVRGSHTNLSSGLVVMSGHVSGAGTGSNPPVVTYVPIPNIVASKFPVTLDRAGAVRALGTISFLVSGIGGASAVRLSANFSEVR